MADNQEQEIVDLDAPSAVDLDAPVDAPVIGGIFDSSTDPEEEALRNQDDAARIVTGGMGAGALGLLPAVTGAIKDQAMGLYDLGKLGVDVATGGRSLKDVYEGMKNLPEEEKLKMLGNAAGMAAPEAKILWSVLLGQLAKKTSLESRGKKYDVKQGASEAAGEALFPLAIGKAAKTAKAIKQAIFSDVAAQNMAKVKGAFAERFIPYDRTEGNKAFARRLKEGEGTLVESGAVDEVSPKAKDPIGDLKKSIRKRLDAVAASRDSILDQADTIGEQYGLNRIGYEDLKIEASDIAKDLYELKDSGIANMEASELQSIVNDVKRSFVDEYSILDPNTVVRGDVSTATNAKLPKDYSIAEVKTKINRAYDKLRSNRFFDARKGRQSAITNADAVRNEVETVFLDKFVKVVQDALAKKIDEISAIAPGQIIVGGNSLSASGEYSRLGQIFHHLKPYEDALERAADEFSASGGFSLPASGKESIGSLNPLKGGIDILTGGNTRDAQRIVNSAMGPERMVRDIQAAQAGIRGSSATPVLEAVQSYLAPSMPTAGALGYNLDGSMMPSDPGISGAASINEALQPPVPVQGYESLSATPSPSPVNSAISSALSEIAPKVAPPVRKSITGYDSEEDAGGGKVFLRKESDRADLRDTVFLSNMPNDKKRSVIKSLIKGDPIDPNDLDTVANGRPRQVKRRVKSNLVRDLVRNRNNTRLAEHGQISKAIERRKEPEY